MNTSQISIKKIMALSISMVFILIVIVVAFDKLLFRQTSSNPNLDSIATSSPTLQLTFSQPLKSVEEVSVDDEIILDITVNKNTLTIPLEGVRLIKNQEYSLRVKGITSKWFNNKINQVDHIFSAKYISFSRLSTEQQKEQVSKSNSGQIDDPFLSNQFPILDPQLNYQIEANTDTGVTKITITFLEEIPDYDNGGISTQLSNNIAEKHRTESLTKIKELGGNPDNYIILYSNNYLNQKYSTEYYRD